MFIFSALVFLDVQITNNINMTLKSKVKVSHTNNQMYFLKRTPLIKFDGG